MLAPHSDGGVGSGLVVEGPERLFRSFLGLGIAALRLADRLDVLRQFLIESVLVCLVGGALGVGLSLLIALLLQVALPDWAPGFSPLALMMAFLCSTLTGVLFGWLPARRAARLNPVDALARE